MFNNIKSEHVTDWHFQHIVDLEVSCSSKSSLLLLSLRSSCSPINFPFPSLNSTVPSLRVTCSFSPAPSCVPRPFQLLGSLVLTVYCPPLSLLRRSHAATTHFTTDIARSHGASILVVTAHL